MLLLVVAVRLSWWRRRSWIQRNLVTHRIQIMFVYLAVISCRRRWLDRSGIVQKSSVHSRLTRLAGCARYCMHFVCHMTSLLCRPSADVLCSHLPDHLVFWAENWHVGYYCPRVPVLVFCAFHFWVRSSHRTDRQMEIQHLHCGLSAVSGCTQ